MSMRRIRAQYNVPAFKGGRIRFLDTSDNNWHEGVIGGTRDSYIRVRMESYRRGGVMSFHPTDNMEYWWEDAWFKPGDKIRLCECGCGREVTLYSRRTKFIKGHKRELRLKNRESRANL